MGYLFAAYTITWIAIFAYTFSLGKRQNQLANELEQLQRAIDK
ncbi:MAG: CcmD family protein [Bacillota bacterium]|nr:CcmD family protein [Bacillota bacterium]